MEKIHCLINEQTKYLLLKNYGDSTSYIVLHICKNDVFAKTDKRIKSKDDFIKLYGFKAKHTEEEIDKALIYKFK